ncbi:hypothetical protein MNBD_ALPHA03-1383 [hydrothermal vent metagenome]|uniref:Cell division protein FtsL n=1 Tax=hydrothermal vent metagenome TaxID=652676 RepID=A0A3B1BBK4_9ZZZZ
MIKVVVSFFVLMVVISAGTVYSLKETTERLEARKHQLSAQILKDRAAIKVLRAEMAYLSQPERLQKLSARFLALTPAHSAQMAGAINAIATREEATGEENGQNRYKLVSFPVDQFPVLLPQNKPQIRTQARTQARTQIRFQNKKVNKIKDKKAKSASFYDRISLTLGNEE